MQERTIKEYIDAVQQEFACCGVHGYSDWFVVDWYPRNLYASRYKFAAEQRTQLAKKVRGWWGRSVGYFNLLIVLCKEIDLVDE